MAFPIATGVLGVTFAFPDVCKTPAGTVIAVVPYPNGISHAFFAQPSLAVKVRIASIPVATMTTISSQSTGDEAGVAGGVASGVFKSAGFYRSGAVKVKAMGSPVILHLQSLSGHNGMNANAPTGNQITCSQVKVLGM